MKRREFKRLVARVMETLPKEFEPYLRNVVVDVVDEPDNKLLRHAGFTDEEIAAGDSLFGLFDPLDIGYFMVDSQDDIVDFQDKLHRLWIFKRPLEEEFPDPKRLRIEVRKTVIHELAHHFCFEENDLEHFDDNPDPFGDAWDDGKDESQPHNPPSP